MNSLQRVQILLKIKKIVVDIIFGASGGDGQGKREGEGLEVNCYVHQ